MGPKPKKSKEEIEAERAAEEAERIKQEAIAAKKAAELAEKQRLEELRIAEERRVLRQAELIRLNDEHALYLEKLLDKHAQRLAEDALEKSRIEWEKFQEPSGQPDATSQRDMNTFISLLMESTPDSIADMLDTVKKIELIALAVQDVWSDSYANKEVNVQEYAVACIRDLAGLIHDKIDQATANYLHFIESHLTEKLELNMEESAMGVSIGMWASMTEGSMRPGRKSVQLEKMGIQLDIPKQVLQQAPFVHRVIKIPIDPLSLSAYSASPSCATNKIVVSDLIYIDILVPPPLPFSLRAKKWLIRDSSADVSSHTLKKSQYPSSVPCKVMIKVPEDTLMSQDVKIAVWNADTREWAEDAVQDFQYSESTRLAQFLMSTVGCIAFVRNRALDFPYKRWSLLPSRRVGHPLMEQSVRFTVHTQRYEVVIDISGTTCSLAKAFNKSVVGLVGVPLSPGVLLTKLQKRGLNLLPIHADIASLEASLPNPITAKDTELEQDVMREMAKCANCLDFTSSEQWLSLSENQVGIMLRESTAYTSVEESFDYECVLAEKDAVSESYKFSPAAGLCTGVGPSGAKYTLVFGNEYGNRRAGYDHKPRPGEIPHIELASAIASRCTPEALSRIDRSNELFQETVYKVLSLVRPFSFTQ